jgi:hypothetical protein
MDRMEGCKADIGFVGFVEARSRALVTIWSQSKLAEISPERLDLLLFATDRSWGKLSLRGIQSDDHSG